MNEELIRAIQELFRQSGIRLELWEDGEYVLVTPEKGVCGGTIGSASAKLIKRILVP